MAWTEIALADAGLRYCDDWLSGPDADALLMALSEEIRWQQHRLRLFGKLHDAPRLSCWIGDPDAVYRYSGTPSSAVHTLIFAHGSEERSIKSRAWRCPGD